MNSSQKVNINDVLLHTEGEKHDKNLDRRV